MTADDAERILLQMDWSFAKSLSEKEQMRLWVENWRRVGPELERLKRQELRALSEEEGTKRALEVMDARAEDRWKDPKRRNLSGLIEQQRLFARFAHASK